MSSSSVALRS